jgi:nucleotide-binding universal stress UspA family protein
VDLLPGKPGEVLVSVANENKAELIITGTRGVGTIRRTILGSVSDYVVHHAHCAVVTVRKNVPI